MSNVSEFEVPHDYEYEDAVLGYLMTPANPPMFERFASILKPEHFWGEVQREVYNAASAVAASGGIVNQHSVHNVLKGRGLVDYVGGYPYLSNCVDRVVTTYGDVVWYGRELKRLHTQRQLQVAASRLHALSHTTDQSEEDLVGAALEVVMAVSDSSDDRKDVRTIGEVIEGGLRKQINSITGLDSSEARYIPLGLRGMDRFIRGLRKSGLYLVSAPTSLGKSLFVQDRSLYLVGQDQRILIFSTEMGDEDVAQRQVFMYSGRDEFEVRARGDLTEGMAIDAKMNEMLDMPILYKDTPGLTIEKLEVTVHQQMRSFKPTVIIVDHFHELKAERTFRRDDLVLEYIADRLKTISRYHDIPVLCVAQQNRGDHSGNINAALKGSGALEQKADCVVFFHGMSSDGQSFLTPDEARERASNPGWMRVRAQVSKVRTGGMTGAGELVLDWSVGGRFFDWDDWSCENQDRIEKARINGR